MEKNLAIKGLRRRNSKGVLYIWLVFLGLLMFLMFIGLIYLESFLRSLSLLRMRNAAQGSAIVYARQMTKCYEKEALEAAAEERPFNIEKIRDGCRLPSGASAKALGSTSKTKEYVVGSQAFLFSLWKTRLTGISAIDDIRQGQCYIEDEKAFFAKNPTSPANDCAATGNILSPFMSLKWSFSTDPYGYGTCCPSGDPAGKEFCVHVNVRGRTDPIVTGAIKFLHSNEYVRVGAFEMNARAVAIKNPEKGTLKIVIEPESNAVCPPAQQYNGIPQ